MKSVRLLLGVEQLESTSIHSSSGTASGSYYQIGNFFNEFSREQLSVMVPVTLNMSIEGYVAIHLPMSVVYEQRDDILNIIYILFFVFLLILAAIIPRIPN